MTYQVVGLLGRGSMAVVELAVDPDGRHVARKRVPLTGSAGEIAAAGRRLRREAEILTRLDHPNIVRILEVVDDGTELVLVMPALAGNLADRVGDHGVLSPAEIGPIGAALLRGLAAAHRAGVVHRDIKPGNVLFSRDGHPALADFGVAVSQELTAGLPAYGSVIGTPAYMSPEQARGEGAGPASDVFALGATLRYALTGETPYGSGSAAVVLRQAALGAVRPLPRSLPGDLRRSLDAMLDPYPERRPSAAALLGGVDGTFGLEGGAVARGSTGARRWAERARRIAIGRAQPGLAWSRRGRATAGLAAVVALALVAVAAVMAWPGSGAARSTRSSATAAARACTPLAFQPCGAPADPHTDGRACLPGWYDLNGAAGDGCEATSDYQAGQTLGDGATLAANLVPAGAVATFTTRVSGHITNLCWGSMALSLTAPAAAADHLAVWHGNSLVGQLTSSDGQPATVTLHKPSCLGADNETLTLRVSDVAGASASDFVLTRNGSW